MLIVTLAILLALLPANLAQGPIPTPVPTPEGWSCYPGGIAPCRFPQENDTSITVLVSPNFFVNQPIYVFECLAQNPNCQTTGQILGYAMIIFGGRGPVCTNIPLTRPLRHSEYIALYVAETGNYPYGFSCRRSVYGVLSPRLYLPILLK